MTTFDPITRRLFILGTNDIDPALRLATVNLNSRSSSQIIVSASGFVEYDAVSNRVLTTSGLNIVSLDPTTGATSVVMALPLPGAAQGLSSYDPIRRRLFYLGNSETDPNVYLSIVNVASGTSSQVDVPGVYGFVEYDIASGRLLLARGLDVVSIDPATGAATTIAPLPAVATAQGISTYDFAGRRLFYLGTNGTDSTLQLATVNVASGTSSQVIANGSFLQYDLGAAAIPTLDPALLFLLIAVIATVGLFYTGR